jgi:hypothetical protein
MDFQLNYGLKIVHPDNPSEILQFCGYAEKPTNRDEALLRIELKDDPDLGLQDLWDVVDIIEASDEEVQDYRRIIGEDE